ncbi:MAG: YraN family protein [Candidatus Campbellbacteria bacterium]|nr:YraN family protein [Candidatus Campbellbacteria bacterium]
MVNNMFITSKEIGIIGENIACRYLTKKKYKIIERNYRKKCGEIDIIAEKDDIIYFFEVKTNELSNNYIRPEERITPKKLRKIKMTAELYQLEKKIEKDVGVRSISVLIDVEGKEAKVYMLKNIL